MAESFDLYIGEYLFDKLKKVKLLLYKETKIIHSLFLSSSSYNKKSVNKFPFSRGTVEFKIDSLKKINETFIPYYDTKPQMRYGIVFEKHNSEDLEKILILIFNPNNYSYYHSRIIGERKMIKFKTKKHEEVSYQHGDLRAIEKVMLEIDNDIKSGDIKLEN
ncbi:hypothetical protein [Formosa algae]|uniref:Uncharacterized protein n=1 Tax=Formosa algae TaxID=225843 RepID=A0A9X0YR83_9FLAO|nr:hypothetical protein [Formosa algae]MBP1841746.1 hypothetical protein [Formosa algae]MDQ0337209.1 hypothetical protein [Formosa algae]OEI81965.1 hypothetical protein AST99_01420 [Formosa algae]